MAHALRQPRRSQFDEITNVPIYYPPIGQKWINRFLIRHPELKSTIGNTIDAARVTDPTRSTLSVWCDTLREVVKDYDIAPENMYNMDDAIIRPYIQRWLEKSPSRSIQADQPYGTLLYQRGLIGCNTDGIFMGCINIIWHTYDHLSDIFDFYT